MAEFDPLRAQREIVAGLADAHKVFETSARNAERRMAEAEAERNTTLKMEAFIKGLLTVERAKLQRLTDEAESKGAS